MARGWGGRVRPSGPSPAGDSSLEGKPCLQRDRCSCGRGRLPAGAFSVWCLVVDGGPSVCGVLCR